MLVVAWILLVLFGIIGLLFFHKLAIKQARTNVLEIALMVFSIWIAALSAGVIWGGLFR